MGGLQGLARLAYATALDAISGLLSIPGAIVGDVLEFDGTRWIAATPTAGGPPGTWRSIAEGSVVLAHNVNTNVVAAFALGAGETHLAMLTPVSDANGVNNILSGNTNGSPGNGNTFWMVQEDSLGAYNFQARQQNVGTAARTYRYVLFGRVP